MNDERPETDFERMESALADFWAAIVTSLRLREIVDWLNQKIAGL